MKNEIQKFRTKEEVEYLFKQIRDRLENLEIEYKKTKKALFKRAEEIRQEEEK